jgi:hypothetical protein
LRGASTFEGSIGYGIEVAWVRDIPFLSGIYAGANIKYIKGYVAYKKLMVLSNDSSDTSDLWGDFKDNQLASNAIGLDIGLLLSKKILSKKVNFGLLARNINGPELKQPVAAVNAGEGSKYELAPQVRGGLAVWPFNWWSVSTDIDLTNNKTPLPGYNSRLWGLGTEINVINRSWFNIALRAGIMKNIAESSSKLAYTGGFGLNIMHFVIDLGGAMSSDTVKISSGDKVPSSASAAATISFDF